MIFWLVSEARVELVRFSRKLKTSRGANFSKAGTGNVSGGSENGQEPTLEPR